VSFAEVARHAGLEMLRRTIGAARVAAVAEDAASLAVVDAALHLVRTPPERPARLVVA
jgi:5-methylthioribose kinase